MIIKVFKLEIGIRYNKDFYYLYIFIVIYLLEDSLIDKIFIFRLIIEYFGGKKNKLKYVCFDFNFSYFFVLLIELKK